MSLGYNSNYSSATLHAKAYKLKNKKHNKYFKYLVSLFFVILFTIGVTPHSNAETAQSNSTNGSTMTVQQQLQQEDSFITNLSNLPLQEFIQNIEDMTGYNFVYKSEDIKGTVTIKSKSNLSKEDLLEIFYSTLAANNIVAVDKKNYIQLIPSTDVSKVNERVTTSGDQQRAKSVGLQTVVVKLNNYDVNNQQLYVTLDKMRSQYGSIQTIPGINAVVIKDNKYTIEKIMKFINILENEAGKYELHAVPVKNTSADALSKQLIAFYAELTKKGLTLGQPVISADATTNTLIIASTPEDMQKIQYFITQLDSATNNGMNQSKVYKLKYASAKDVYSVINGVLAGVQLDKTKTAPSTMKVAFDNATNSIIAIGTDTDFKQIQDIVDRLDIERQQVYVEALILETDLSNQDSFGVEWLAGGATSTNPKTGYPSAAGFASGTNSKNGHLNGILGEVSTGQPSSGGVLPGGYSLGIMGNIISYKGKTFPTISALVSAVVTDTGIEVLSSPQILTLDNEPAEIFVGEERPFTTSRNQSSEVRNYDYKKVGINLKITPHVSGDDQIILRVNQTISKLAQVLSSDDATLSATLQRATNTTVKLQDGEIMVISGLMANNAEYQNSRLPWLSRIPLIGWLFRSTTTTTDKQNMMVFITARLITSNGDAKMLLSQKINKTEQFNKEIYSGLKNSTGDSDLSPDNIGTKKSEFGNSVVELNNMKESLNKTNSSKHSANNSSTDNNGTAGGNGDKSSTNQSNNKKKDVAPIILSNNDTATPEDEGQIINGVGDNGTTVKNGTTTNGKNYTVQIDNNSRPKPDNEDLNSEITPEENQSGAGNSTNNKNNTVNSTDSTN